MDTATPTPTADEAAHISTEIDRFLAEMRHLNTQMAQDQIDIERLRAEGRTLQAETRSLAAGSRAAMDDALSLIAKMEARQP